MARGGDDGGVRERALQRAAETFGTQIELELCTSAMRRTFAKASESGNALDRQAIREEVESRQAEILDELSPVFEEWVRREKAFDAAKRRLSEAVPESWLVGAFLFAPVAYFLALFAFDLIALEVPLFFVVIGGLTLLCLAPLVVLLVRRLRVRRLVSLPVRRRTRLRASYRFWTALGDRVRVAIREAINLRLRSYELTFRLFDERGLRELSDPEREVPTSAGAELIDLMASLSSGSIGISGPRGVGKTTLINSVAQGRLAPFGHERVGLVVSAPVHYDALEFVLHLFASLCEQVLGGPGGTAPKRSTRRRGRLSFHQLGLGFVLVSAVTGGALLLVPHLQVPSAAVLGQLLLTMAFGVGVMVGLTYLQRPEGEEYEYREWLPEREAEENLERIRFQRSVASGWDGGIRLPFGMNLNGTRSSTIARAPWSLPEAIEEFRRFAARLAEDRYLVIGIDELDKMDSDEDARHFLNNIKGVFGVSGCYYLVSASEDAMSSFERRGLPIRDVFDSAFDAMQPVGYLTLEESQSALESRVTGLPVPFQCLCHCMAGGLPRDLIRVARGLVQQQRRHGLERLGELCRELVRAEWRRKLAAAVETMRAGSGERTEWLLAWLDGQGGAPADPSLLREAHEKLMAWDATSQSESYDSDDRRIREVALEIDTFNYYAATVMGLFGEEVRLVGLLDPEGHGESIDEYAVAMLEDLAGARQQFSISPRLAWERVTEVRERTWLADPWTDPRLQPAGQGDGAGGPSTVASPSAR